MKTTGNTFLITGGSSGLGLEMSRRFLQAGNKVIICSRSAQKLEQARKLMPSIITYRCDISDTRESMEMMRWLEKTHPDVNVLINNAAIVHKTRFLDDAEILEKLDGELRTNLEAPIRLIRMMYPIISRHPNAAIINITTGLAYIPRADYPFYNSTKSALHAFTKVLRHQVSHQHVKIIEVLFPAVDTPWHNGNPPKIAISPQKAVDEMIAGLEKGKTEIRVAGAKILYLLSRVAPAFAFRKINSLQH
jgi:uncharacterized oxidoreductase